MSAPPSSPIAACFVDRSICASPGPAVTNCSTSSASRFARQENARGAATPTCNQTLNTRSPVQGRLRMSQATCNSLLVAHVRSEGARAR